MFLTGWLVNIKRPIKSRIWLPSFHNFLIFLTFLSLSLEDAIEHRTLQMSCIRYVKCWTEKVWWEYNVYCISLCHLKNRNKAEQSRTLLRITAACYLYVWEHFILKAELRLDKTKTFLVFPALKNGPDLWGKVWIIFRAQDGQKCDIKSKVLMNRRELKT